MLYVEQQKRKNLTTPRRFIVAGYVVIGVAFGVFGTWAATVPLASAVVAPGTVSVESDRKTIQHLEGGIVNQILVKEAQIVEAGDPLVILDPLQSQGNVAVLEGRQAFYAASQARLLAESIDATSFDMPKDLTTSTNPAVIDAVNTQLKIFADRRASKDSKVSILQSQADQLQQSISGLNMQLQAIQSQLDSTNEQIARLQSGQDSGAVATNDLAALQRQGADLQGQEGAIKTEIAKTEEQISETKLQIIQTAQDFRERASTELKDVVDQLNETSEKLRVAKDTLDRTVIRSPVRGVVQNIRIHTLNGVLRAAEPIMDVVPLDDNLVITAHVRPLDIDSVQAGADVEVRFPAFSSRTTPLILGKVAAISADSIIPEDGRSEPYYEARVEVQDTDVPTDLRKRLVPGMPADAMIATGERTFLEYLTKPLEDAVATGMREK